MFGVILMKKVVIIILILFFITIVNNKDIISQEYETYEESNDTESDSDYETRINELYEEEFGISFEDLSPIEQIQIGYYEDILDKYLKQLKTEESKPAYKSDASYAISEIMSMEEDDRPIEPLLEALEASPLMEHTYIRRYAALALGYVNDERAINPLIRAVRRKTQGNNSITDQPVEEDLYVRLFACFSLGNLRATSASREIANILKEEKEPRILRRQAAISLGLILDDNVYHIISDMLKDTETDKLLMKNIIWALGQYGKLGYKNEFVLKTLLKTAYKDTSQDVMNLYNSLEELLYLEENYDTYLIIEDSINKLKQAISKEEYRNYLNTLYEADNINIGNTGVEAIVKFIDGLKNMKRTVFPMTFMEERLKEKSVNNTEYKEYINKPIVNNGTVIMIEKLLKIIRNPEDFDFPEKVILIKEIDYIYSDLAEQKRQFDNINISSTKRDDLKKLLENAYNALSMIEDSETAKKQAQVYLEAKEALQKYSMSVEEEETNINEPVRYLQILKNKYIQTMTYLDDFYSIYARRESINSIRKIYIHTYKDYMKLLDRLYTAQKTIAGSLNDIRKDKKKIVDIRQNLLGKEYSDYFLKQVNYDLLDENFENYLISTQEAVINLKEVLRDYKLLEVHDPKTIIEENIDNKKMYRKESKYGLEDFETSYNKLQIEEIITKNALETTYSNPKAFNEFIENGEILNIYIETDTSIQDDNPDYIGKIIEESFDNESNKIITIKTFAEGNKDILLNNISQIKYHKLPQGLIGEIVTISTKTEVFSGTLQESDFDSEGKKAVLKTYSNEKIEVYLKDVFKLSKYEFPEALIGEKVIIQYKAELSDDTITEIVGDVLSKSYNENGINIILKTHRNNEGIGIPLNHVTDIIVYDITGSLIGENVIVKMRPEYYGFDKENAPDTFITGILLKEGLDNIVLQTVGIDNIKYEENYKRIIYLQDIEAVIKDYTIPDILSIGIKSIESEELIRKLKYDKDDSIMMMFDRTSKNLSRVSSEQSKFPTLSVIMKNAANTLEYYPNSDIASKYKESINNAIESFLNIERNISQNAKLLSELKTYIRDNVHNINFEINEIKTDIFEQEELTPLSIDDDDTLNIPMVSALNDILVDLFQNDKDIYIRINSAEALVGIDYTNYISSLVNILSDTAQDARLRVYAFETINNYGFPLYHKYSKEDLEREKYNHIKIKIEEMKSAQELYEKTIYKYVASSEELFKNINNFKENHIFRELSIQALRNFNNYEAVDALIEVINTPYIHNYNLNSKENSYYYNINQSLRISALRILMHKKFIDFKYYYNIDKTLRNILRNLDESLRVRIECANAIGKLAELSDSRRVLSYNIDELTKDMEEFTKELSPDKNIDNEKINNKLILLTDRAESIMGKLKEFGEYEEYQTMLKTYEILTGLISKYDDEKDYQNSLLDLEFYLEEIKNFENLVFSLNIETLRILVVCVEFPNEKLRRAVIRSLGKSHLEITINVVELLVKKYWSSIPFETKKTALTALSRVGYYVGDEFIHNKEALLWIGAFKLSKDEELKNFAVELLKKIDAE